MEEMRLCDLYGFHLALRCVTMKGIPEFYLRTWYPRLKPYYISWTMKNCAEKESLDTRPFLAPSHHLLTGFMQFIQWNRGWGFELLLNNTVSNFWVLGIGEVLPMWHSGLCPKYTSLLVIWPNFQCCSSVSSRIQALTCILLHDPSRLPILTTLVFEVTPRCLAKLEWVYSRFLSAEADSLFQDWFETWDAALWVEECVWPKIIFFLSCLAVLSVWPPHQAPGS